MARPFAAFDIDGTVIRWQLYHALADELAKEGVLDAVEYDGVRKARMNWKQREKTSSFQEYEAILVQTYDRALSRISVAQFEAACQNVMQEYKDQVYTYTRDLIKKLRHENYLLFAISASQAHIVKLIAEHYGFDDSGGTAYSVKDGYFAGMTDLMKRDRKPAYIRELATKHGATYTGSIAVGDSESDIPMLASVERPIAFNPSRELFTHAQSQGWEVVIERKNMIYELKADNGLYVLAQTGQ